MKSSITSIILFIAFLLTACRNDEPDHADVFMQIESITNDTKDISQQFSYDPYGRITTYRSTYDSESTIAEYEYISQNLIRITTKDTIFDYSFDYNGVYDRIRIYQDELHLENGRAVYCDGIFTLVEHDEIQFEKKYRREYGYTSGNLLNTIKFTEWNKVGDKWAEDRPWTWENYYYWENGNLVTIEDCLGHSYPVIRYTLKYNDVSGVQNVVFFPLGFSSFGPLQIKGIFGSQPVNLISDIHRDDTFIGTGNVSTSYQYEIKDGRISSYQELLESGRNEIFSVRWTL